jgi:hypothetical protein
MTYTTSFPVYLNSNNKFDRTRPLEQEGEEELTSKVTEGLLFFNSIEIRVLPGIRCLLMQALGTHTIHFNLVSRRPENQVQKLHFYCISKRNLWLYGRSASYGQPNHVYSILPWLAG